MKRNCIVFVLIVLMALSLCSCGAEKGNASGNVEEVRKNEKYVLVRDEYYSTYVYSDYVLDEEGKVLSVVKSEVNSSDKPISVTNITYTYDDNGNVIERNETCDKGYHTYSYEYSNDGLSEVLVEHSDWQDYRDGNTYRTTIEKDSEGRVISRYETLDGSDYWFRQDYTYDEKGHLIQRNEETARSTYIITCESDEYGNVVTEKAVKKDSNDNPSIRKMTYELIEY